MSKNDYTLEIIDELNKINGMPEDGCFQSSQDKAYRLEALRKIFCGLRHGNQDKVLRYAMENLRNQMPCTSEKTAKVEMKKGGAVNG